MRRFAPSLVLVSVATFAVSPLLHAQRAPKRPALAGADTNSAAAYYRYAISVLLEQPDRAADALYWATELDPSWAQALYARRIALIMAADDRFVIGYFEGRRAFTRSKQALRIDSLELRARMLNPLFIRELDKQLLLRWARALFESAQRDRGGAIDRNETGRFEFFVEQYWQMEAPARTRARLAVTERRFSDALELYRRALTEDRDAAGEIHAARAQVFYAMGVPDSARVEMQLALDNLRTQDAKDFVYLYESKGVLEHSIGLIYESQGLFEQAREAYGRALQEDLSYYPAHLRLGLMALSAGDTAVALSEMDLAVQIKETDALVQTTYAVALVQTGRLAEARPHLRRAVELAPFYAASYYVLGRVAESEPNPTEAIEHYRAYLARARASDPRVADAQQRLTALLGQNR